MYKEHILDLYKHPHNFGKMENPDFSLREFNPLCGDDLTIQVKVKDGKIEDVKFFGNGCAISIASASLLTDKIKGMKINDVKKMKSEEVIEMLGIPISPARVKCVLLCFEALKRGLKNE